MGDIMQVTYEPVKELKNKNCFEIEFDFEHGDGDSNNSYSLVFNNMNEQQLIEYVKKANEISEMIDDSRSSGIDLPKDFYAQAKSGEFEIPIELDNYAKMHMSNYYASSGISKIFYYNEDGNKYEVTVK
jgi:hypothetical protein